MPRVSHPLFARVYPLVSRVIDQGGMAERRDSLLDGLTGEVIEVGCGDGKNFPHYPAAVTGVRAVEPEPHMRRLALAGAANAPVPVSVTGGRGEQLPAADASADAAVFCFSLCSIADPGAALREAYRVLRPGGELRYLEHVRADTPGLIRAQRLLDATIWPRMAGGCVLGHDAAAAIREAGFAIERLDRFLWPPGTRSPFTFFVQGTARRP